MASPVGCVTSATFRRHHCHPPPVWIDQRRRRHSPTTRRPRSLHPHLRRPVHPASLHRARRCSTALCATMTTRWTQLSRWAAVTGQSQLHGAVGRCASVVPCPFARPPVAYLSLISHCVWAHCQLLHRLLGELSADVCQRRPPLHRDALRRLQMPHPRAGQHVQEAHAVSCTVSTLRQK